MGITCTVIALEASPLEWIRESSERIETFLCAIPKPDLRTIYPGAELPPQVLEIQRNLESMRAVYRGELRDLGAPESVMTALDGPVLRLDKDWDVLLPATARATNRSDLWPTAVDYGTIECFARSKVDDIATALSRVGIAGLRASLQSLLSDRSRSPDAAGDFDEVSALVDAAVEMVAWWQSVSTKGYGAIVTFD